LTAFAIACGIFALIGFESQLQGNGASGTTHPNVVPLYLATMVGEWCLLFFVWRGMRAYGTNVFALVAVRWKTPWVLAADLGLGTVLGVFLVWLDAFVQHLLGPDRAKSIDQLLPQGPLEIALWVAVSITAGVVEELVFRGYLMRQLAARLPNLRLAVVAQAVWFGVMHSYEGLHSVASIVLIGLAFGLVAVWRRQLRANVVAHACIDLVEGIAPRLFSR